MATRVYTGRPSEGGRNLSRAIGALQIRHDGNSRYRPRVGDVVINWGCSTIPDFSPASIINSANAVKICTNKSDFFHYLFGPESPNPMPRMVPFTEHREQAAQWVRDGHKVVCRTVLTGHSGRGIIIAETENQLVDAPLYTQYVPRHHEYRVHVVRGRVIDVQRKIRDPSREPTDWHVRSHQNGFIFVRGSTELSQDSESQCLRAIAAVGLDFGAVDLIQKRDGTGYVLEVNTAPGLTGTTLENYARIFREEFDIR